MTPITLTPKVIFTNDLFIVSAFEESRVFGDFDKIATKTASERNSIYLSTTNDNILSLDFKLIGATTDTKGPNITLDILDPTDQFETLIFSRRISKIPVNSHFYLAFGTDAEFVNWSNILKVTLVHAELFNEFDQAKTIRLHLFAAVRLDSLNIDVFNGYTKDLKEFDDSLQIIIPSKKLRSYNLEELISQRDARKKAITDLAQKQDLKGKAKDVSILLGKIKYQKDYINEIKKLIEFYESKVQELLQEADDIRKRSQGLPSVALQQRIYPELARIGKEIDTINQSKASSQTQLNEQTQKLSNLQTQLENTKPDPLNPLDSSYEEFYEEALALINKVTRDPSLAINIYNFPEYEKELLRVFKGYSSFDVCFKEVINKLLNALYSDEVTTLFLIQDTEKIFYDNSKTELLVLSLREALKQTRDSVFYQNRDKNIYIPEIDVTAPTYTTITKFSDDNLKNYKNYLTSSVKPLLPKYFEINIVEEVSNEEKLIRSSAGIKGLNEEPIRDPRSPFGSTPRPDTVLYQEVYEGVTNQELRISINIPRRDGETDDSFKVKITDFFLQLERGLSIVDKDGFQDNLILIAESDTTIINNFYDFLDQTDIGKQLIREFKIRKNKPLVILGQYTVVRALLYGEQYLNTKTSIVNTITRDYFSKLVKPKLKNKSFNMYGEQNNLLSNLEKLLQSNSIKTQEFISNVKNITDDLLIFKYNVENPNILSIKVDDYKAYTKYLLLTNNDPTNPREASGLDFSGEESVGNLVREQLKRSLEFPIQDKIDNFIDYLLDNTDFKQTSFYSGLLIETIKQINAVSTKTLPLAKDYQELITKAYNLYDKSGDYLKFAFAFSRDASLQYEQMYRGLQVARFRVTIKTLPFFFVSNYGYFRKNCLLLAKRVNLINTKSNLDNIVTGGYEIIGIKHRITSNSAESEFILQRLK